MLSGPTDGRIRCRQESSTIMAPKPHQPSLKATLYLIEISAQGAVCSQVEQYPITTVTILLFGAV